MPVGIIVDCSCVVVGGVLGALFSRRIPEKLKLVLPMAFSLAAMTMGIAGIVKMNCMPAVVLALLLGTIIGVMLDIEMFLKRCGIWAAAKFAGGKKLDEAHRKKQLEVFSIAVIIFCAGATGLYGAISSAVTGDHGVLLAKAVLDIFTNVIFGSAAGISVALLGIPMFVIFMALYLCAGFIVPLTTPAMFADFACCGGLLMLATGFRMAEMKIFHVADMLPALVLVMPISYLWTYLPI